VSLSSPVAMIASPNDNRRASATAYFHNIYTSNQNPKNHAPPPSPIAIGSMDDIPPPSRSPDSHAGEHLVWPLSWLGVRCAGAACSRVFASRSTEDPVEEVSKRRTPEETFGVLDVPKSILGHILFRPTSGLPETRAQRETMRTAGTTPAVLVNGKGQKPEATQVCHHAGDQDQLVHRFLVPPPNRCISSRAKSATPRALPIPMRRGPGQPPPPRVPTCSFNAPMAASEVHSGPLPRARQTQSRRLAGWERVSDPAQR